MLIKLYNTEVIPAVPGDPGQVGYISCPSPPPPPPPPGGGGEGPPSSGGGSGGGGGPGGCPDGSVYTCIIVQVPGDYGYEFCYCQP
jgi:hypothetical protein